jgi:hypothetical protein
MEPDEWNEFIDVVKANVRSHAGYYSWLTDRNIEELGVVQTFHESLTHSGSAFFHSYQARGRGNDPPDCEARSCSGGRVGIEVTELVDGASIAATKSGAHIPWEPFPESELSGLLAERIKKKDNGVGVKDGPYDEYVLIIYCDEPRVLYYALIQSVRRAVFPSTTLIDRAFLVLSYSPWEGYCPYIELNLNGG